MKLSNDAVITKEGMKNLLSISKDINNLFLNINEFRSKTNSKDDRKIFSEIENQVSVVVNNIENLLK